MMGRRHHTTSLTSPVLALALAGCDKAVESVTDSTDTSDTDAPKGWLRRFIDKVTDFDEPSDYGIAGGVAIGTVAVVGAAAGGGDSATSGGGASTPTNRAPSFSTDTATATAIAENSGAGQLVYTPTAPTDPEGDTLAYSLKDTGDHSAFTIDSGTGAVTLTGDPNFETKPSYAFTIVATDTGGLTDELPVTLAITNVVENPSFASSTATGATIAENSPTSTAVYTAPVATGDSGGSVTYSVVGTDATYFTIDQNTRKVTFLANPNYETKSSYKFKVRATDGSDATKYTETDEITVTLENVNEAPVFAADGAGLSIAENSATTTTVYTAPAVTDPDTGDTKTYAVIGTDSDFFTINQSTRIVTFKTNPDYEVQSSYSFMVRVTDSGGATDTTGAITVTLTNVNTSATDTGDAAFAVTGDASGALVAVLTQDDPEGNGTFTYKWQKSSDGSTWNDISGATSASYTPQSSDGYVRLQQVTYTDDGTNSEIITLTDSAFRLNFPTATGTISVDVFGSVRDYFRDASGGNNSWLTFNGDDILYSLAGNDTLNGGNGDDVLYGGVGDDVLSGDPGNDILYGGAGDDAYVGEAGNDIFALELASGSRGADVVADFATGNNKIRVDAKSGKTYANLTEANALEGLATSGETLSWVTNTTTHTTNTDNAGTNDTALADTIFFIDLDNDDALDSGETVVLILEDYSTPLTSSDFNIV